MIRLYPIILLLQLYCLYHAYTNKTDQKWYWIILIFPFFGSMIYLYKTFYSRSNIDDLEEGVKTVFVNNYKIEKLEKQLKFSDTLSNKIELADEYSLVANYSQALVLYKSCLKGIYKDDPQVFLKIVRNSYLDKDYDSAIFYGEKLIGVKDFLNSEERVAYAWSNYFQGNIEITEQNFEEMDIRFSNYKHRLEYANFLKLIDKDEESKRKLEELLNEIDSMDKYEKRSKKSIHKEISNAYNELVD